MQLNLNTEGYNIDIKSIGSQSSKKQTKDGKGKSIHISNYNTSNSFDFLF